MTFLAPLGLLAAIAIVILIIIYIIRPNYQQKYISSTFVWKLSLKYKKKRIPTSKLRDILIIICQVATLACCALVLAQPVKMLKAIVSQNEVILVLDASSSMATEVMGDDEQAVTRYSHAVEMLEKQALQVLETGGYVSVIRADDNPAVLLDRITKNDMTKFNDVMDSIGGDMDESKNGFSTLTGCSYGSADIEGAMKLCENILDTNPSAVTYLYTDIKYTVAPESVQIIDCRLMDKTESGESVSESNAAILNVDAEFVDGYYRFDVRVASYGGNKQFGLMLVINDANGGGSEEATEYSKPIKTKVECPDGEERVVTFKSEKQNSDTGSDSGKEETPSVAESNVVKIPDVISYSSATVRIIDEADIDKDFDDPDLYYYSDNYQRDNVYELPGSSLPTLKVVYASSLRTPFFEGTLDIFETQGNSFFGNMWSFSIDRLRPDASIDGLSGYDFYIFEGRAPSTIPTDGAVFMMGVGYDYDNKALNGEWPKNISGKIESRISSSESGVPLTSSNPDHPVMRYIDAEKINVTEAYTFAGDPNGGYTSLIEYNGKTMFAVKNGDKESGSQERAAIMTFIPRFSNLSLVPEFPFVLGNLIEYFLPATLTQTVYSVGETISVNSRGYDVTITEVGKEESEGVTFTEFPSTFKIYKSGRYVVRTMLDENGTNIEERNICIQLPSEESNIFATVNELTDPYHGAGYEDFMKDLVMYVAAALVFFMFAEWLLHLREGI